MSRKLKTNDEIIFPIIHPKRNIEMEAEDNPDSNALNLLKSNHSNGIEHVITVENEIKNDGNTVKDETNIQSIAQSFSKDTVLEEVVIEESIFKIVSELATNDELINVLSNSIAEKLITQLNSKQIVSFISKHSQHTVDSELLNYSIALQEIVNKAISNSTSKLLKNKTLKGGN